MVMSIKNKLIELRPREIAGASTSKRFSYQIAFAADIILDFIINDEDDFLLLLDYFDDVVVLDNKDSPECISFYQVKTSKSFEISLTTIISSDWLKHMNENNIDFNEFSANSFFISNGSIKINKKGARVDHLIFDKTTPCKLSDIIFESVNKSKIEAEIKSKLGNDVDLSKLYFCRSMLSLDDFKNQILGKTVDAVLKESPKLDIAAIKSIFNHLFTELTTQNNNVYSPVKINFSDIVSIKGFTKEKFDKIIDIANKSFSPMDVNVIIDYGKQQLGYDFHNENIISIKSRYNNFSIERIKNQETHRVIIEEIDKLDLTIILDQDIMSQIISLLDASKVSELNMYQNFKDFIIINYIMNY
jgi:hypothetical protein